MFSVCGLAEASAIDVIKEKIAKSACIILRILQGISGIVAVLMMVLAGLKWMSSDDPESRSDARTRVLYILIGLFLIFITLELVNVLASGLGVLGAADCGMLTTDPGSPELLASIVDIILKVMVVVCRIVKILSYIFAVIAAILIIFAGFMWMTSDNPETRHSSRNIIAGVVVGVVFIVIAYHIVSGLFATMLVGVGVPPAIIPYFFNCDEVFDAFDAAYPTACICDTHTDVCDPDCPCDLDCVIQPARKVICRLFRVLQAIAGVLAALVIMTSGVTWFTSGDIEKKSSAKGMIISAVLGLILVVVSLQLVNSIIIGMSVGDFNWDCGTLVAPGEVTDITDPIRNAICVIIRTVQLIVGLIVVLIITYSALQFASSGDPEARAAARSRAIYAIIGLIAVLLAMQLINAILTGMGVGTYNCTVAASTTATLTGSINSAICVLLYTLQMAAVVIAAIILVLVGMEWMSSDDPEGRAAAKKKAAGVVIALIIIVIAMQLVDKLADEILGIQIQCPVGIHGLGAIKDPLCIILRALQGIIAIVAALLLVLVGVQWMISQDPQARTRAKVMAGRIVVGFVVAFIAVQLVNALISGFRTSITCAPDITASTILAGEIRDIVCLVLRLLELVALIVAALVLVFSGIQFMSSDSSESRSKAKSMAIHAIIGLIIVLIATQLIVAMADPLIPGVYCDYDYEGLDRDHYQLVYRIQRVACIIYQVARLAGFFCATIVLLISGLVWISSDSAEGRSMAKRMILHVIIGLVILLLALELIIALIGLPSDPLSFNITSCSLSGDLPEDIRLLGCMIIKILEYFAIVVAMVVLILAGLLYMAADSPQARSRIKIVVGAIIVGIAVVIVAIHLVNAIISQVGVDDMDCSGVDIDEDVRRGVEAIGCSLIRMIQLVCGIAATVIIILAGIQWMVSDDPETRNNARSWIIVVAIGLIIILVGMHFVNALITTDSNIFDIADISC